MNRLNLSEINLNIPYTVWEKDGAYLFKTDYGIVYKISFMEDDTIWDSGAYQFLITNLSNVASPNDSKLKLTILYLLESFFKVNNDILLYICETGDGKQAMRNRLFMRWFQQYSEHHLYYLKTVEIQAEGMMNFAAIIVRYDNPRINEIIQEFDMITKTLGDKPN